jgi:CRP-like cAMP-binding protein
VVARSFLSRLAEPECEALLTIGVRRTFAAGSVLLFQDEQDDRVILILSGRVKVIRADQDNHELLLAIRDAGDLLGELAFIDGLPRVATVSALEAVEALVMTAGALRAHLRSSPDVAVALLESVTARFREDSVQRMQFAALDTLGRLSARIVELADRYGQRSDEGIAVEMPISQDELATWTGASRAGVAKALQTLRELGWLETERRVLILRDVESLRDRSA